MPGRIVRRAGDVPTKSLWTKIKDVALTDVGALARSGAIEGSLEKLEEVLLEADFGVAATMRLVGEIEGQARRGFIRTQEQFLAALEKGKFSDLLKKNRMSVLVGAADTFRAGAIDQLRAWAQRTGADFVGGNAGSDPASVAFDAVDAGINRGSDVVIVDTAGRLHTSSSLMDEMKKINRVIGKRVPGAPHETLLVLDGTIGQNAVAQAKTFAEAIPVTGLVVTKIDGTAKGGIVVAVHEALNVPVKFIGIGEKATDLEAFDPGAFAREVLEQ